MTKKFNSAALKANLEETAVDQVIIDPAMNLLLAEVVNYRGIHSSLEEILTEIYHPYRNWQLILPRLRTFALGNAELYCRSPKGPESFRCFNELFFLALTDIRKNDTLLNLATESILAYAEQVLTITAGPELNKFDQALTEFFTRIHQLNDDLLLLIAQGQHPIKKISQLLSQRCRQTGVAVNLMPLTLLFQKVLELNYRYWLKEENPLPWFLSQCQDMCNDWDAGKLFNSISHEEISRQLAFLQKIELSGQPEELDRLLAMPAHIDIVRLYREIPPRLASLGQPGPEDNDRFAENRRLLFLFRIMRTPGLHLIHEESLREINRSLVQLIRQQTYDEIKSFLLTTLELLKENISRYPHTALQCIQVLGAEVFNRGSSRLVETFLWETVRFGFQYANVTGVDEDWQPITNPSHLANIRVWLNLIMQEPKWCATLFSALIINLKLSGTCVKDTDLFQRDISRLLNHPIEPVYNLVKQFAKLMPVFFNEIGAEGQLRDVSTEIDEIHKRKDLLIHFLRKQSHVESSNLIVDFIRAILGFWHSRDKNLLKDYLPPEILEQIPENGLFVNDLNRLARRIFREPQITKCEDLLLWDDSRLNRFLSWQEDLDPREIKRFQLLIKMYRLLDQKYNLGYQELRLQLEQAANGGFPEMEQLLADLEICDTVQCLNSLLTNLEKLKKIILSSETFEPKEDIYYKRHIAVDIPSVYGCYNERKFNALGLSFRLESLANIFLEQLPSTINLTLITRATFLRILKCLRLYLRALKIDGITSRRLETSVSLLSNSLGIKRFSYTQYLDIFRSLSEGVKDLIYAYYTNVHQNNLSIIIPQIGVENLLARYRNLWQEKEKEDENQQETIHRLSETFMRDLIAQTFGLQHLDNFITRIYQTLERQKELLDQKRLDLLMTYNPEKVIHHLRQKSPHARNIILLGNKGFNLSQLAADQKPVPPGFIITTEIFRCWSVVKQYRAARDEFMDQVLQSLKVLEKKTGRLFQDPHKPLLVSVRSGASISMPGMMATIHNVGLNEEIVRGFAASSGQKYLAWDNFRRFLQSWAMGHGVEREIFQNLMNEAKERHSVKVKKEFTPTQMQELALSYKTKIEELGIKVPEDPWQQLIGALEIVLISWDSAKTKGFRHLMNISDSWGTAVIVQAMVYGNLNRNSGSGVVFTAHPYRKVRRVALWGDYAPGDQGEDIVSGLVSTYAISVEQAEIDGRPVANTLERRFPAIYRKLLDIARDLVYKKQWNPQELEFTFESPEESGLYILQTRDMMTIKKKERFNVFADQEAVDQNLLGKGLGVSGSALSGLAVFNRENIKELRRKAPDSPLILIRQDTVPEDIREISTADGLLTARGGQTSHASLVTIRLEKTCLVGCRALQVYENEEKCLINGHTIRFGDQISIDGRQGLLLQGGHQTKEEIHILPI